MLGFLVASLIGSVAADRREVIGAFLHLRLARILVCTFFSLVGTRLAIVDNLADNLHPFAAPHRLPQVLPPPQERKVVVMDDAPNVPLGHAEHQWGEFPLLTQFLQPGGVIAPASCRKPTS